MKLIAKAALISINYFQGQLLTFFCCSAQHT